MRTMGSLLIDARKIWHDKLAEDETWFHNVITLDEAWTYCHEPAMNQAISCWLKEGSEPPLKQRATKSTQKCMAITFFDHEGVIFTHWVPQGQTVNKEYMIKVLSNCETSAYSKEKARHDE